MRLLAHDASPHGQFASVVDLAKAAATFARDSLLDRGDLTQDAKKLRIVDPLYRDWLRRTLPL